LYNASGTFDPKIMFLAQQELSETNRERGRVSFDSVATVVAKGFLT